MLGFANYIFILIGIAFIVGSIWDYKVYNKRIWGYYRKKKGIIGGISGFIYRLDILRDYWNGILGIILCLVGFYGILNDIHDKNDKDLSDMMHDIFHKNKEDKE